MKSKPTIAYALALRGCRTPATDADRRYDIYETKAAAMSSVNREPDDRLIEVEIRVRAPKRRKAVRK